MANSKQSIAGVAHGAKPSKPGAPSKQWYPQLSDKVHPDVTRAFQDAYDKIYELRGNQQAMDSAGKKEGAAAATGGSDQADSTKLPSSAFSTGIHGVLIKAPTDSSSLKEGMTLVYNAAIGQFEFKMP